MLLFWVAYFTILLRPFKYITESSLTIKHGPLSRYYFDYITHLSNTPLIQILCSRDWGKSRIVVKLTGYLSRVSRPRLEYNSKDLLLHPSACYIFFIFGVADVTYPE